MTHHRHFNGLTKKNKKYLIKRDFFKENNEPHQKPDRGEIKSHNSSNIIGTNITVDE